MQIKALAAVLLLALGACSPISAPTEGLPFSTIEQKNDAAYIGQQQYNALDPGLLVFLDADAASQAGELFSEDARALLKDLDWNTHFSVAVFQGWQAGGGYRVEIRRITPQGDAVWVEAAFLAPETIVGAVTSPYHLVAVRRPVNPIAHLPFELVVDGETMVVISAPQTVGE